MREHNKKFSYFLPKCCFSPHSQNVSQIHPAFHLAWEPNDNTTDWRQIFVAQDHLYFGGKVWIGPRFGTSSSTSPCWCKKSNGFGKVVKKLRNHKHCVSYRSLSAAFRKWDRETAAFTFMPFSFAMKHYPSVQLSLFFMNLVTDSSE